jgi:hypothetical protein
MKNKWLIILIIPLISCTLLFGCGDSEKKARVPFNKAQALIRDGKEDEGKKLLNEVISKYPETMVASDANKILNEMYAAKALTNAFKNDEIEAYNQIAKTDLKVAAMAQQMYFIDNISYTKSIEALIKPEYGLYITNGVKIYIKHADEERFTMESYHEKGTKTYVITSDSEEPEIRK